MIEESIKRTLNSMNPHLGSRKLTGLLAATLFAANLSLAQQPDITKLSVAEINKVQPPSLMTPVPAPKDVTVKLTVDASQKFQTIEGFGTATYAYNKKTHQIYAKPEFQKLVVEDLGLSMIRFEIVPAHFKPVRKPEEISRKDFVFEGQVEGIPVNPKTGKPAYGPVKGVIPCLEFIAALKKLDPQIKVIPSVWSPPAWMKTNGKPAGGGALKPECYEHFARYLAEWARFVKEKNGFDLYALSPQNELEFSEPYNSCIYKPEEFRDMLKAVGRTFQKDILNVKLFGPEDMTHYGPRTVRFIKAVDGKRSLVQGALSSVGGRLHYAMAYGQASAWMFWQISGTKPDVHSLMVNDQPGKKYYVAKHFYRFIRPGAVRIAAGPDGGDKGLCVTAYQHEKDRTVTVVLLNRSHDNATVNLCLKATLPVSTFATYRSTEKEDCVTLANTPVQNGQLTLRLPPRAIVTMMATVTNVK